MNPNQYYSKPNSLNSKQVSSQPFYPHHNPPQKNWNNLPTHNEDAEDFPPGILPNYPKPFYYHKNDNTHFPQPTFQESRFEPSARNFRQDEGSFLPDSGPQWGSMQKEEQHKQPVYYSELNNQKKPHDSFQKKQGLKAESSIFKTHSEPFYVEPRNEDFQPQPNFSKDVYTKVNHPSFHSAMEPARVTKEENVNKVAPVETKESNSTEEIMKAILHHQINCVSLLNEVGSKVKKRVDYMIKEIPSGKLKIYECVCIFDKDKIGEGKGNSKQGAKTDSATEGVRYLLSQKQLFDYERAHITLSVQRTAGLGGNPAATSALGLQQTTTQKSSEGSFLYPLEAEANHSNPSEKEIESEPVLMNDSALYELNLIAKECFIEPQWSMSPPHGPNGQFQTKVTFDKLEATGEGRKKLDAKRDAAFKIIQQIRGSKELSERYNPKAKKKLSPSNSLSELNKNDQRKNLFESSLDLKIFGDIQSQGRNLRDIVTKFEKSFENYLISTKQSYELEKEIFDQLHDFFKQVSEFTDIVTSNPKQLLLESPDHLADYLMECSLVPISSFALDCVRKDKLIIDAVLVFQTKRPISEGRFLELYHSSLFECQKLPHDHQFMMEFSVESSDLGNCLVVKVPFREDKLVMKIYPLNLATQDQPETAKRLQKRKELLILHVQKIYEALEDPAKLKLFRDMASLMRTWREKNGMQLQYPEITDAVLLSEVANCKHGTHANIIINCLLILSSEETLKRTLEKCGAFYAGLYEQIEPELKQKISMQSQQSLEAIHRGNFENSLF